MPKTSIKLCKKFYSILQDESFDYFTLSELRDAYLSMLKSQQSVSSAYNFVYRQVSNLEKNGLLTKHKKAKGKNDIYQKMDGFIQANFCLISLKNPKKNKTSITKSHSTNIATTSQLNDRLMKSEIDLLASIGESEEYMRLCNTFPEMRGHLKSQYILARENSSKLLGQIKAIKSVLAHQKKPAY
jgi:hypothetical protein